MHPITHALTGMAAAGVVAGPQRPLALVAGAAAGVLPDLVDWWLRQVIHQPDITVTPDPLAPAATTMAQGVRAALLQVRELNRPCVVRLNPLPAPAGGFVACRLDMDRSHRLVVALEPGHQTAPVDPPGSKENAAAIFTPQHPLPLRIADKPVELRFRAQGPRIESSDLALETAAGHGLPVAALMVTAACALHFWCGMAAAAALATHVLLEAGGRRAIAPWAPFSSHRWRGRRLWNECSWQANLAACVLACALLAALLAAAGQ